MTVGIDWEDMHPSAFPTPRGTSYTPPELPHPPPVPEHVWLGDLAGWSIGLTTDADSPIILHRCGYAHLIPAHENFLANVADWVSKHRDEHSCQEVMTAFREGRLT